MFKKIILILLLPMIFLTACNNEKEKDIFTLHLTNVKEVIVQKNITISNGTTNFESLAYITDLTEISKLNYTKDAEYSTPLNYKYQIILSDDDKLHIIDNATFVYNGYKCDLVNSSFDFLDNIEYHNVEDVTSLKLSTNAKEFVITKPTGEILYLNTSDRKEVFINKMNSLGLVLSNDDISINIKYKITYDNETILVFNHKYIQISDVTYKIIRGSTTFLDEYTHDNTDKKQQSSEWLPWV